jgi:hypothetical protein
VTIWDPVTTPVDYVVLAGRRSPGIAEVSGAYDDRDLLVQQQPFTTGSRIVYRRRKLAEFTVRITLYDASDHADFDEWRKVVDTRPTSSTEGSMLAGLDIWHPLLVQIGVSACVVRRVSQLIPGGSGEWSCEISFVEYVPEPRPTLATVEAVTSSPGDPVDAKIDQDTARLNGLLGELL